MAHIRKSIDIISPSDGKRYTSIAKYEKSLDSKGQYIMEEKTFNRLRERLIDEGNSVHKSKPEYNHVHIDLNNGRTEISKREI